MQPNQAAANSFLEKRASALQLYMGFGLWAADVESINRGGVDWRKQQTLAKDMANLKASEQQLSKHDPEHA
ncbi:MAG: hypothetical protein NWE93_02060 [Candidatus Bathyarchaeota archaeon]|nr:hypothetical protein [Candidatus Bathyarchaeota archaeon]